MHGHVRLLTVFERIEAVREDMAGELALVREPGAAVHAGVGARRPVLLPILLQNKRTSTSFRLMDREWQRNYFQAFLEFASYQAEKKLAQEVDAHFVLARGGGQRT